MKQYLFITLLLSTAFLQAAAQDNKPEEKTIVNKEFDEEGNLIQYDSTFVWSWSGDSAFQFESPMNSFFLGNGFPGFDESILDSAFSKQFEFFGDSAFVFPFEFGHSFGNDLFSKDFDALHEMLMKQLNDMNEGKPDFESQEAEKAWQELMEKQRKEQQEFLEQMNKQNTPKSTDKKENQKHKN